MATLDITQSNGSGQHVVFPYGTVPTVSDANNTIMKNTINMIAYLTSNGYTVAQTQIMTKNDLIFACRQKLGITYK